MPGIATNQIAIRDQLILGVCLTIDQLDYALADIARKKIVKSIGGLISRGYLERVERGCYQLTEAGEVSRYMREQLTSGPNCAHTAKIKKPLRHTVRQRAWNVMRINPVFTYDELAMAANKSSVLHTRANIEKYVRKLVATGFVNELTTRTPGSKLTSNGFKKFSLIKNTGPIAPVFQGHKRGVFDHNTGEFSPCK